MKWEQLFCACAALISEVINSFWCRIAVETLGDLPLRAGPSVVSWVACPVHLVWMFWGQPFGHSGGNRASPALTANFHFHPYRDPQEYRVTLETQDFLYVYKITCFLCETFNVSDGTLRWFFYFGHFFTLLIAGYSWPRWSTGSPRNSRMQRDKGKFRTETLSCFEHVYLTLCIEKLVKVVLWASFSLPQLENDLS